MEAKILFANISYSISPTMAYQNFGLDLAPITSILNSMCLPIIMAYCIFTEKMQAIRLIMVIFRGKITY